jgi:hypothetical protein
MVGLLKYNTEYMQTKVVGQAHQYFPYSSIAPLQELKWKICLLAFILKYTCGFLTSLL